MSADTLGAGPLRSKESRCLRCLPVWPPGVGRRSRHLLCFGRGHPWPQCGLSLVIILWRWRFLASSLAPTNGLLSSSPQRSATRIPRWTSRPAHRTPSGCPRLHPLQARRQVGLLWPTSLLPSPRRHLLHSDCLECPWTTPLGHVDRFALPQKILSRVNATSFSAEVENKRLRSSVTLEMCRAPGRFVCPGCTVEPRRRQVDPDKPAGRRVGAKLAGAPRTRAGSSRTLLAPGAREQRPASWSSGGA